MGASPSKLAGGGSPQHKVLDAHELADTVGKAVEAAIAQRAQTSGKPPDTWSEDPRAYHRPRGTYEDARHRAAMYDPDLAYAFDQDMRQGMNPQGESEVLKKMRTELKELKDKKDAMDTELEKLKAERDKAKEAGEAATKKHEQLSHKLVSDEQQRADLQADLKSLKEQMKAKTEELEKEKKSLQDKYNEEHFKRREKEVEVNSKDRTIEDLKNQKLQIDQQLARARDQLTQAQMEKSRFDGSTESENRLRRELESEKRKVGEVEDRLKREKDQLASELRDKRIALDEAESREREAKRKLAAAEAESREKEQDAAKKLKKQVGDKQEEIDDLERRIKKLVHDIRTFEEGGSPTAARREMSNSFVSPTAARRDMLVSLPRQRSDSLDPLEFTGDGTLRAVNVAKISDSKIQNFFRQRLSQDQNSTSHDFDLVEWMKTQEDEIQRLKGELEKEKKEVAMLTGDDDYGREDGTLKDQYIHETTKALQSLHLEGRQGLVNVKSMTALLQVTHGDILKSLREMLLNVSDTLKEGEERKAQDDAKEQGIPYKPVVRTHAPAWQNNDPLTWTKEVIEQADMKQCKLIVSEVERKFAYDARRRMMDADKQALFQKLYTSIPNKAPLFTSSLAGNATNMMPSLKDFLFPIDKQDVTSTEGKMFELALSVEAFDAPTSGAHQNDRLALQKFREFLTAKFGDLQHQTKYITLWSSPVKAVTLPVQARQESHIPVDAAFYSYCYPYDFLREKEGVRYGREFVLEDFEAAHINTQDPFVTWILCGGFIYYDYVYEILAINAIASDDAIADGFVNSCVYLGVPTRMMANCVQTLKDKGRWKKVTHTKLVQQGFLQFVWVTPSEMIDNTIFTRSGGFAYQFKKMIQISAEHKEAESEFQYWFFPIVPYSLLDRVAPTIWESPVHIPEYINYFRALQLGSTPEAQENMDFSESKYVPDVSTMQAGEGHLSALGLGYVIRMCKYCKELVLLEKSEDGVKKIWQQCLGYYAAENSEPDDLNTKEDGMPKEGAGEAAGSAEELGTRPNTGVHFADQAHGTGSTEGRTTKDGKPALKNSNPEDLLAKHWARGKKVQAELKEIVDTLKEMTTAFVFNHLEGDAGPFSVGEVDEEDDGGTRIIREFVAVCMCEAWNRKLAKDKPMRRADDADMIETFNDGDWMKLEDWKNLMYVLREEKASLEKVKGNDGIETERDKGRKDISFKKFVNHPEARNAHLSPGEVLALRLYTTSSFKRINVHLREASKYVSDVVRKEQRKREVVMEVAEAQHRADQVLADDKRGDIDGTAQKAAGPPTHSFSRPMNQEDKKPTLYLPHTTYLISTALKKLRVQNLNTEDFLPTELWRGMKNVSSSEVFVKKGGAEGACMSTTPNLRVVASYSKSNSPLLLKIKIDSPMDHGADISWLSVFPGEQEVLYPPLTFLKPLRVQPIREMEGKGQVITVKPSFPS